MCAVRPEQDATERSAEREEPVPHPPADRTGRPPDEIGTHDPHLLGGERWADELVALQAALRGGPSEESAPAATMRLAAILISRSIGGAEKVASNLRVLRIRKRLGVRPDSAAGRSS